MADGPEQIQGEDWNRNFRQCLELLRGPGDERRFVGLLLVTRLLPQGSDDAIRQVLAALGTQFLHRLLLPLRNQTQAAERLTGEAAEQQLQGCGLALAILAAGCRLPEVAAGPDVRELVPLLLRVVKHGGLSPLLQLPTTAAAAATAPSTAAATAPSTAAATAPSTAASDANSAAAAADAAAVSDALECLAAAAAFAPSGGPSQVVEPSAGLDSLAAWLPAAAARLTSPRPVVTATAAAEVAAAAAAEVQWHSSTLLAAALLQRLLAMDQPRSRATAVMAEMPAAAARIMAALAAFVGNPRLLLLLQSSPPPAQSTKPPQQHSAAQVPTAALQQTSHSDTAVRQDQNGAAAGAARARAHGPDGAPGGAAQLQLEALHLLLVMLTASQEPAAAAAAAELVRLDEQLGWSAAVRRGLGWLLRSRVPGSLKHRGLQLAACVVELAGEGWLLGRAAGAAGRGGAPVVEAAAAVPAAAVRVAEERPEAFLQLLAETLRIEIGLLLQDALHPDRRIPAGETATLGNHAPPQPSQRLLDELAARAAQRKAAEEQAAAKAAAAAAAAAAGGGSGAAAARLEGEQEQQGLQPEMQSGAMDAPEAAAGAGGTAAAEAATVGGGRDAGPAEGAGSAGLAGTAGQRALVVLPACFRLFEGCVEAVAVDAAAADGLSMDLDLDPHADTEGGPAGAAVMPEAAAAAAWPILVEVPILSDAAMQKLMASFDATVDSILQFFEAAAEPEPEPQLTSPQQQVQSHSGASPPSPELAQSNVALELALKPTAARGSNVSHELRLGAARALGRYLAEAPGALRNPRVLRALPLVTAACSTRSTPPGPEVSHGPAEMEMDMYVEREGAVEEEEEEDSALPFLLPGLLQATGPGAEGRSEVLKSLRSSPSFMDACSGFLARRIRDAAAAAEHLANAAEGSGRSRSHDHDCDGRGRGGGGGGGGSAAAIAATDLSRAERGLADVSMLLLNLLEPSALARLVSAAPAPAPAAAGETSTPQGESGAAASLLSSTPAAWAVLLHGGRPRGGGRGGGSWVPSSAEVETAAAAAGRLLPPLLARHLLPLCWSTSRWAAARRTVLEELSSLDLLHHSDPHHRASTLLAAAQLTPRSLLCLSCLAAVSLAAAMRRLADDAGPASHPGTPAAAAVAAILPPPLVETLCALSLAASAAGASLELQQRHPTLGQVLPSGSSAAAGQGGNDLEMAETQEHRWALADGASLAAAAGDGTGWRLTPGDVAADYSGDGEVAWERLLAACAQLVEVSVMMRRVAHGSVWLRRLAELRAGSGGAGSAAAVGAVRELLLEVNLALLLQVVAVTAG